METPVFSLNRVSAIVGCSLTDEIVQTLLSDIWRNNITSTCEYESSPFPVEI